MSEQEALQPKKRRKKSKSSEEGHFNKPNTSTVGIRKTALMKLAEEHGDTGLMNPRTIDPLVHMLAELGETAFGKTVIENCRQEISLSNAGFPKQKALGFLADQMIRKYVAGEFNQANKDETARKLARLPVLNQASYTDYFMTVSLMEKDAFRTRIAPVMNDMVKMVTGYQTEQPFQVCDAVAKYFKVTKDQKGFESVLKQLCLLVKSRGVNG